MPYIDKNRRALFDSHIEEIVDVLGAETCGPQPAVWPPVIDLDKAKGDLNYVIFRTVKEFINKHGMRYAIAQDMIGGVLTCCQLELYRRLLADYEDEAIKKNGDVE